MAAHSNSVVSVRPSAVIEAPAQRVWSLLTRPDGFGTWTEAALVAAEPEGRAHVGQMLYLVTRSLGWAFAISIEVLEVDAERRRLHLAVELPYGLVNDEVIEVGEADDERSLVRFDCRFSLPPGWRGALLRFLLSREVHRRPAKSLARLKRAAEALP